MREPLPPTAMRATRKPCSEFVVLHSLCKSRRCGRIGAKRSAKLIAKMEHANLCTSPVAGEYEENGAEDVSYVSLAEITESGSCSEKHTAALIRQILIALEYLHSQGVVHGAIRSDNIFIEASTGLIKVALEVYVDKRMGEIKCLDVARCSVDTTSLGCLPNIDIWAVGIIAQQLLSGCFLSPHCSHGIPCSSCGSRLCRSSAIPNGLSMSAAAFLLECFSLADGDAMSSLELLDHPFMLFPLAVTALGEEEEDPSHAIDDCPLILDDLRRVPSPLRPSAVPSLKLAAPELFSSPSQTERSAGAKAEVGLRTGGSREELVEGARERGISRILFADDFAQTPLDPRKRKASSAAGGSEAALRPPLAKVATGCASAFSTGQLAAVCAIDPPRGG